MQSRLRIPAKVLLRQSYQLLREDWRVAAAMTRLQLSKETFHARQRLTGAARRGEGESLKLIGLRITDLCNLRCHSCGQWGDNGFLHGRSLKELRTGEVPVEVYRRMVDDVFAEGWRPLWYIWGGEPTLYPGWKDLLRYISSKGMPISLVTNGTNLARHADDLVDCCTILHVSLDGPDAAIHNAQRPGASSRYDNFRDVQAGLEAVRVRKKERGSHFPLIAPITCITSYNLPELHRVHELAARYADFHILYLTWWIDEESAVAHERDFSSRFGEAPHTHRGWLGSWKDFDHTAVLDQLGMMRRHGERTGCPPILVPHLDSAPDLEAYYTRHGETFGYDRCVSIFMSAELGANGDVSLCRDYHDYVLGNVRDQSLVALWKGDRAKKFRASLHNDGIMPACRRCCGLMGY